MKSVLTNFARISGGGVVVYQSARENENLLFIQSGPHVREKNAPRVV